MSVGPTRLPVDEAAVFFETLNLKAYTDWMQDEGTTIDACSEADAIFRDTTTFVILYLHASRRGLARNVSREDDAAAGCACHRDVGRVVFSPPVGHQGSRFRQHVAQDLLLALHSISSGRKAIMLSLCGRTSPKSKNSLRAATQINRSL